MKRTPLKRKTALRAKRRVIDWDKIAKHLARKKGTGRTAKKGADLRRKSLTQKVNEKPRARLKQLGKKGTAWARERAKLKVAFERAGITTCEAQGLGCWRDNGLGFAHTLKRRNATTPEQLREVVLACNHCHDALELLPEHLMAVAIRGIIAARPRPVVL